MLSMKLLLAAIVMTGVLVAGCDLGFGLAEFSDKVTVSNIGSTADAFVSVKFNHGQVSMGIEAGKSGTAIALAATKYTVNVVGRGDSDWISYKDTLLRLREQLDQGRRRHGALGPRLRLAVTRATGALPAPG